MKRSISNESVSAVSKRQAASSSGSIKDDEEPQSLFVVVSYMDYKSPYFCSIIQLGTGEVNDHEHKSTMTPFAAYDTDYSAHFCRHPSVPPLEWAFSPLLAAGSTEGLFMLPDCEVIDDDVRLHGYIFNLRTNDWKQTEKPESSKLYGNVVRLRGHIYLMPRYGWMNVGRTRLRTAFERYNLLENSWEPRKPFPLNFSNCYGFYGRIVATAVLEDDDTILMNIDKCNLWAYDGGSDEWYEVCVSDKDYDCYEIEGEAVVVGNSIYALTRNPFEETILELSIKKEEIKGGGLKYTCSIRSRILVPGMREIRFDLEHAYWLTCHLVHLGKDKFCLVRSCGLYGHGTHQPIQVTYMKKVKGQDLMTVTKICLHRLAILHDEEFEVSLCFSLPNCKTTTAFKQEGDKPHVVDFEFDLFSVEGFKPIEDSSDSEPEYRGRRSPSPPL